MRNLMLPALFLLACSQSISENRKNHIFETGYQVERQK